MLASRHHELSAHCRWVLLRRPGGHWALCAADAHHSLFAAGGVLLLAQLPFPSCVARFAAANGEGIPLRAKVTTLALLWGAITISAVWLISLWWARALLVAIASAVTLFLLAQKTRTSELRG
jgi:hypothetical protein